jgi:hypothetical protein
VTKQEHESFTQLVKATLNDNGGRLDAQRLAVAVAARLGAAGYKSRTWTGFVGQVATAARSTDRDGLVTAAAINGVYVQRTLWGPEDYRYKVRDHMRRGHNEQRLAYVYADECKLRFGVVIDVAAEVGAAV